MATSKELSYFQELEQEIDQQRTLIRNQYRDFDGKKSRPTYDNGFLDGTLAGLKLARSLWYKNFPGIEKDGEST